MRSFAARLALLALLLAGGLPAQAGTLGDPTVGFRAERILVFNGHRYVGLMWSMPGEQRHEQNLPAMRPVFILHAGSGLGDLVLPDLHTVVEFALPKALAVLGKPGLLGNPVGHQTIDGIATTRYAVAKDIPEGHLAGDLWLSGDGIPMRCDGSLTRHNGKVETVHWELRHVVLGSQPAALFAVPRGYAKLPPEAAANLFGMRFASPRHPR